MYEKVSVVFRWLGAGGIEIRSEGKTLLVDPFLTRPDLHRLIYGKVWPDQRMVAEKISAADYVLVTHSHFDHVMDVPEIVRRRGAQVFGSENTRKILLGSGISPKKMNLIRAEQIFTKGPFQIKVMASGHVAIPGFMVGRLARRLTPPFGLRDYRMDNCFSFLIRANGLSFLDWVDSDLDCACGADVLLVVPEKNGGYYQRLLFKVRPKLVVLIHWENLFRSLFQPPVPMWTIKKAFPPFQRHNLSKFKEMIKEISPDVNVLIPEPLRYYAISRYIKGT